MIKKKQPKLARWKAITFSLLPLFLIFLTVEFALEVYYFHRKSDYPLAVVHEFQNLRKMVQRAKIRAAQEEAVEAVEKSYMELAKVAGLRADADQGAIREQLVCSLYEDYGKEILEEFQGRYTRHFSELARAVEQDGARFMVLYIPSLRPEKERDACRRFFAELAQSHGIEFVDTTPALNADPPNRWTLSPLNAHLSRYGSEMVAHQLVPWMRKNRYYRKENPSQGNSEVWGDLVPGARTLWLDDPLVYYEEVNKQGLRGNEIDPEHKEQRLLLLGDSFMYGPYLPNKSTIPGFLERLCPWVQCLNGAVAGYTIQDQKGLYLERARFSQPDLVILQVLDNDISGQYYFYLEKFARDRKKQAYRATPAEKKHFSRLREILNR